ncbi:haloacid dehalogenase-like hydrolase [SAR202 cluster bacterium AD-802-F09_MRT_200m]|nr:haloacid dehalogenase-like hydrolase [SAR202 cluster bacterium AD-802-F09_MRT_200m]
MNHKMHNKQIALVFDFDGTVAPDVMLAPIFDMIGIKPGLFWDKTNQLTEEGYDREIAYLQALVLICADRGIPISNSKIRDLGARLQFYHGFPDILERLKNTSSDNGHELGVYVITAGLEEMVLGSRLGSYLTRCWGCGFAEETTGVISHPKRIVTSANKVEKLYLIKRQLLEHGDTYRVNLVEPKDDLVPWNKVIYVADGATDVPAFEVVRRGGGFTLAVYDPDSGPNESTMISGRTHLMVEADYRPGSQLDKALTDAVITATSL